MKQVSIDTSPITQDALGHLRDKTTNTADFRMFADRISLQVMQQAVCAADLVQKKIKTPIAPTQVQYLAETFVFVTILRAGLAMLRAACRVFPSAPVGFVGLKRDETTAIAHEYYSNLPKIDSKTIVIVGDPMLATGGSMCATLEKIAPLHPKEIRIVTIVCAPEGIAAVRKKFPDITIVTAAVDSHLNDKKYIVPGLGDFGDRYFGTEA